MDRLRKLVLALFACAIPAIPTLAAAQTPGSSPALDRVPAPVSAPAPVVTRIPVSEWGGFYAGGTIGYGGSLSDTLFNPLPSEEMFGFRSMTLNPKPMGWTYGFHGGWNMPRGNLMFGVEADYAWSSIGGNTSATPVLIDGQPWEGTWFVQQDLEWLSTVRGRVGCGLANKYMVYATGGIAWGGVNSFAEADLEPGAPFFFQGFDDSTRTGWTIGGGIEGSLTERLAWRVQYLYVDFGSKTVTGDANPAFPPFQMGFESQNKTNSFTFGASYRF